MVVTLRLVHFLLSVYYCWSPRLRTWNPLVGLQQDYDWGAGHSAESNGRASAMFGQILFGPDCERNENQSMAVAYVQSLAVGKISMTHGA